MPLTVTQQKELESFTVLYGVTRFAADGTSIFVLVRRPEPLTDEDMADASEAVRKLENDMALSLAKKSSHIRQKREYLRQEITDIFVRAGINAIYLEEIENGYWPDSYAALKYESPWFIVTTPVGHFRVGWRKRVLEIDWSRTTIKKNGREIFKEEDVTKEASMIHAWGYDKAAEYLARLVA